MSALRKTTCGAVLVAMTASGCIASNTFQTARTLPQGEVRHAIGMSFYGYRDGNEVMVTPVPSPSYSLRYGLSETLELGGRLEATGQGRFDLKYNPVRSRWVDLAVAPAVFGGLFPTDDNNGNEGSFIVGADAPMVLGLNASTDVRVLPWIGPGIAFSPQVGAGAIFVRGGLGLELALGNTVTLHPEVTFAWDMVRKTGIDAAAGLAVGFGARPSP